MKPGPPKAVEAAVALLIPPRCREHVLGDLHERYVSPWQYIVDAARTAPLVIASQVHRATDPQLLLIEAFALYLSFLAVSWRSDGSSFLYHQSGFLLLAIPAGAALCGLILANGYADSRRLSPGASIRQALFGVAFAVLSQGALSLFVPELLAPLRTLVFGSGLSLLLISTLRTLFAPGPSLPGATIPPNPQSIRQIAEEFQRKIRRRNGIEYAAALIVIAGYGCYIWLLHPALLRAGSALEVAGALYVMYQMHKRGSAKPIPADMSVADCVDFHRQQLIRQRALVRRVWSWYLGPLVPGLAVFTVGALATPPVHSAQHSMSWILVIAGFVLVFYWVARRNRRAADKLQRQIDELNGSGAQQ
jgi:hypothetical protein